MKKLIVVLIAMLVIACVVFAGCNTPRTTSVKEASAQEQEVIYVVVTATPSADNCVCPTPVPTEVVVEASVETEVAVEATEEVVATAEVTAEAEIVVEATEEVEVVAEVTTEVEATEEVEAVVEATAEAYVPVESDFEYEIGIRYTGNMNFPDFTAIPYGGGGFIYTISPDAPVSATHKVYGKCAIAQFAYNGKVVGSPLVGFIPEAYIPLEIQYEYMVEGLTFNIYDLMWQVVVHNEDEENPGFSLRAERYNGQTIIAKIWLSEKENQYWEIAQREDGTYVALTGTVASTYKQYVEAQIPVVEDHGGGGGEEHHHEGSGEDTHFTIQPTDPDPLPVNPDPIDWGSDEEWGKGGNDDTDFTIG